MAIEELKLRIIEFIVQEQDQEVIVQINEWLHLTRQQQAGMPLPILTQQELLNAVDEAKTAAELGNVVPHEQVRALLLSKVRA